MAQASTLRPGHVVRVEGRLCKVVASDVHQGGGRMGTLVHAKLRDLETGHVTEPRYEPKAEVEVLDVERVKMQASYPDGEAWVFMNPGTFDQVPVPKTVIGPAARFLKEGDEVEVEFWEEKALSVRYPDVVELAVRTTGEGIKGGTDSTYKEAVLENGIEVLVPQFVKEGDRVRVDVETGKYLDRVKR